MTSLKPWSRFLPYFIYSIYRRGERMFFCPNRIRTLWLLWQLKSFYWLIMGKMKIGMYCGIYCGIYWCKKLQILLQKFEIHVASSHWMFTSTLKILRQLSNFSLWFERLFELKLGGPLWNVFYNMLWYWIVLDNLKRNTAGWHTVPA